MWSWKKKPKNVETPVDLNKPVENPNVLRAIEKYYATPTNDDGVIKSLMQALNQANYLVVRYDDEAQITRVREGIVRYKKDSILKFPFCKDEEGRTLLPLFTDWEQIKACYKDEVSAQVMPSAQAWNWALNYDYQGIVINAKGQSLPLDIEQIKDLARSIEYSK